MNADQLATDIASGAIINNLPWTILALTLAILGALGTGFCIAWAQKRGEVAAARADSKEILKQLGDRVGVEEEAKSVIQRAEWKAKELATVRRIKLEELMTALIECNEYLLRETLWWYRDGLPPVENNPAFKFRAIALLYFPEIDLVPFQKAFSLCRDKATDGKRDIEGAKHLGPVGQQNAQFLANKRYMEGYSEFNKAATAIEKQVAPLMHELLEVSITPPKGR